MNTPVIHAQGLAKSYRGKRALAGIDLSIPEGRIVGLIGPNGAGKTTALKSILGLIPFEGQLSVLGLDPRVSRDELMKHVCFIADVAVLPRWMKVSEAISYVEGVHPRFSRQRCEAFLASTQVKPGARIRELSKGMIAQLHLALVMAIDAKLLVLDEPTLGLDILYRKQFYQRLLEDYFDENKTIVITTHQVEEVEHILTDALFIRDGRVALSSSMDDLGQRFSQVLVDASKSDAAMSLNPVDVQVLPFNRQSMLFDGVDRAILASLGEVRTPGLSDLFVATMKGTYA